MSNAENPQWRRGQKRTAVLNAIAQLNVGDVFTIARLNLPSGSRSTQHRILGEINCVRESGSLSIQNGGPADLWRKVFDPMAELEELTKSAMGMGRASNLPYTCDSCDYRNACPIISRFRRKQRDLLQLLE